jgi:hypothetical protein
MRISSLLTFSFLLAGCGGHGDTAPLSTLLTFDVSVGMVNDTGNCTANCAYASLSFGNPWKEPCDFLSKHITAALDGTAATAVDSGHADDYDGIYQCSDPGVTFALPPRQPGSDVFFVQDASATLEVETTDLFAPRSVALVAPTGGVLTPSQSVTLQWAPGGGLTGVMIGFVPDAWKYTAWSLNAAVDANGRITFTTPSSASGDAPLSGSLFVTAQGTVAVARCATAKSCAASFRETAALRVSAVAN